MTPSSRKLALFTLLAAILLALAWLLGLPELATVAVAGWLTLMLSAAWAVFRGPVPAVRVHIEPTAVFRGDSARLVLSFAHGHTNGSDRATAPVRVFGRLATAGEGILAISSLKHSETANVEVELVTPQRGVINAGPFRAVRSDPLNCWQHSTDLPEVATLVVRPKLHTLPAEPVGAGPMRTSRGARSLGAGGSADDELVGLRPYVRGDDLRRVHWRTSARRNHPHVVQVEPPTQAAAVVVVLDDRSSDLGHGEFERAVEAAASVLHRSAMDGHPVRLLTASGWDSGRLAPTHYTSTLDMLARVAPRSVTDLPATLLSAAEEHPDAAIVLCTAASELDSPVRNPLCSTSSSLVTLACGDWPPNRSARSGSDTVLHWDGSVALGEIWTNAPLRAGGIMPRLSDSVGGVS